jgi:hypothetical protein
MINLHPGFGGALTIAIDWRFMVAVLLLVLVLLLK